MEPDDRRGRRVGRVRALWRYPVKSMAAEPLVETEVSWNGFAGDRRWAFVRDSKARSGFPWFTVRERNDMLHFEPSFSDASRPDASATVVRTPTGRELDVWDPELAAELGGGLRAHKNDCGVFDSMALSLVTTQTVTALGELVGRPLDVQRFRPNLLVEADDAEPYAEEAWVGSTLRIGAARMRVDQRDQRCVMINVDPVTAERDPAVLRAVAAHRQTCVGVYGSTVQPGRVGLDDEVWLEPAGS